MVEATVARRWAGNSPRSGERGYERNAEVIFPAILSWHFRCGYSSRCLRASLANAASRNRKSLNHKKMQQQPNERHLPDPSERPHADIVIYDGQCRFCTGQVQRLARWDGPDRLAFLSLHDPRTASLCPDLSHDQLMQQMYVVTSEGQRYGGAAAIRYLSRHLPRLWIVAPLLHIPGTLPLWQRLYMWVAKRRYRISHSDTCDSGTCDVHLR